LRYTDPTGHWADEGCGTGGGGGGTGCTLPPPCTTNCGGGGGGGDNGGNGGKVDNDPNNDGSNDNGNNQTVADALYSLSSIAQDIATFGDTLFLVGAGAVTAAECVVGADLGGLLGLVAGCAAGATEAFLAYNISGFNAVSNSLSNVSTVLTITADILDDGQIGENTFTSVTTSIVGQTVADPLSSGAVNFYGSAYDHGLANSVPEILSGSSIFK